MNREAVEGRAFSSLGTQTTTINPVGPLRLKPSLYELNEPREYSLTSFIFSFSIQVNRLI